MRELPADGAEAFEAGELGEETAHVVPVELLRPVTEISPASGPC